MASIPPKSQAESAVVAPSRRVRMPRSRVEVLAVVRVLRRALVRLWGRDVMLYVGGVSFFALLAVFPALTLLVGLYATVCTPEQAAAQAASWAWLLPPDAQELFQNQVTRLTTMARPAVSVQSGFAILIGVYAAHRGMKALLAGLSFIHEEDKPRGFVGFNVMAAVVAVAAFGMVAVVSTGILVLRVVSRAIGFAPLRHSFFSNEWTWAALALTLGLSLLYRFAMSSEVVGWRASIIAGATASLLSLGASALSAVYVGQIANLGATYGGVGAVVVFLIWLSWNVNAVFFGGALATETEIAFHHMIGAQPAEAQTVNLMDPSGPVSTATTSAAS
ncbi:YihY/virulence factor BrkB family protein [soil metagenome]